MDLGEAKENMFMTNKTLARIIREANTVDLLEVLAERLPPTDLQTLLLEVYRRRAERLQPRDVLQQYSQNRFVRPSPTPPQTLLEFDQLAFAHLPADYEPVELSPVAPLGSSAVVGGISQNKSVTTIRNTEVVSDSTGALALECARRRQICLRDKTRQQERVKLCASHRLLRGQHFQRPDALPHFRLLALGTAGRDAGHFAFEMDALREHIGFYLELLTAVSTPNHPFHDIRVTVTELDDEKRLDLWQNSVLNPLAVQFPAVSFAFNQEREEGITYYTAVCFHIHARDEAGNNYQLADGGFTDWTQQYLSSRKERLLTSGIGSERVCAVFGHK